MTEPLKKFIFEWKIKHLKPKLFNTYLATQDALESNSLSNQNLSKRVALIEHAIKYSPFYRNKFLAHNIDVKKPWTEKEFLKLPITSREELRDNFETIKVDDISRRKYYKITTSGSTGAPISVLHDKRIPLAPIQWRLLKWWGINPYDNKAFIYRYPRTLFKKIFNTLLWWPTKRIFLAGADMSEKNTKEFLKSFNKIKPALLQGYTDVVYEFALFLKESNLGIHSPTAVWVTSGPLTQNQRLLMEDVFGAPVYDQYGSTEVMGISAECDKQNGLHIMKDMVHVECLDDDNHPVPPNTLGKLVLTDLYNYTFPIIRYEIGDFGRLLDRECTCGVQLPLMEQVCGRKPDVVVTPSGLMVYGDYLTKIFDSYPNSIKYFQIVQQEDYTVELIYVPLKRKNIESIIVEVIFKLRLKVKNEIPITPRMVDKIVKIGGKTRLIVNHLK